MRNDNLNTSNTELQPDIRFSNRFDARNQQSNKTNILSFDDPTSVLTARDENTSEILSPRIMNNQSSQLLQYTQRGTEKQSDALYIASNTSKATYGRGDFQKYTPIGNQNKFDCQMKLDDQQQTPSNLGQRSAEFGLGIMQFNVQNMQYGDENNQFNI